MQQAGPDYSLEYAYCAKPDEDERLRRALDIVLKLILDDLRVNPCQVLEDEPSEGVT